MTTIAAPTSVLSNGICVANFSSPHAFDFLDGSTLPRCSEERCNALSLGRGRDVTAPWQGPLPAHVDGPAIVSVKPIFDMTPAVMAELEELQAADGIDIILVPFPILAALERLGDLARLTKVGTVIMADRVTKKAAIDGFGR